jgi:hypothetical protein
MRILVGAVISLHPFSAGMAWNWMQYAAGFRKLGHDVWFVEEIAPQWCVDREGRRCRFEDSVNRSSFLDTMERFGLLERCCQVYDGGESTSGLSRKALADVARSADLLVNMSGHVKSDWILGNVKRRAYVDQDPVFTQLWNAEYGKDVNFGRHDVFFSVGLDIGTPRSTIPDCGLAWRHTVPPVDLSYWPVRVAAPGACFTAIASWSGYGDLSYRGEWYRTKYDEFMRFAELPERTGQPMELLLKAYRDDDAGIRRLRENAWVLSDASRVGSLTTYQDYIAASRAEIGVAKGAYVKGRSGWFSDRSAHYLASGRPVLAQATGFEHHVPTGKGLLAFSTVEDAVEGVRAINREYEAHCRAARQIAEDQLDCRKVLPKMLEDCA